LYRPRKIEPLFLIHGDYKPPWRTLVVPGWSCSMKMLLM